jgi:drug/metabolite transporter (DMT)-like permease
MTKDKNVKGYAAIFAANALWGLNAPISKVVLDELPAITITTFRMVGAAIMFWLISMFLPKEHVNHRDMLKLFFASLLGVVLNQGLFMFGLSYTSPVDASIVTTLAPIIAMIVAAIYLKEPITSMKVMGVFIGALGAFILILSCKSTGRHSGNLLGDMLCLTAQISFALYLTFYKDLISKYSPITIGKWLFIYASICFIPLSYGDIVIIDFTTVSFSLWLRIGYIIIGGTFLSYICLMSSQSFLRPTLVSMYNYIQPVVASIVMILIGADVFGWQKTLAFGLAILGVFCVTLSKSRDDFEQAGKEL